MSILCNVSYNNRSFIFRDDFEQMDIPYNDHVKFEHNMWHYLWFWIHLESKDPLSYTGPEQYAFMNYATKNVCLRSFSI